MDSSSRFGPLVVLGGPIYPEFTHRIIEHLMAEHPELNVPLEPDNLSIMNAGVRHVRFHSGAICPELPQVRDRDVVIVDPLRLSGEDIWSMTVMANAAFHASAARITAVMPFHEGRQDRKHARGVSITAALGLRMLEMAHVNRFLSLDLHAPQIQGMNDNCQFDTVFSSAIFLPIMTQLMAKHGEVIVMGTDHGSVERNGFFAGQLNCEVGFVDKRRGPDRQPRIFGVLGNVSGKTIFLVDDIIDTATSFIEAAKAIMNAGALRIIGFATHPVLSIKNDISASSRLAEAEEEGWLGKLYLCDTLRLPADLPGNVEVISAAPLIAKAIYLVHTGGSISSLILSRD